MARPDHLCRMGDRGSYTLTHCGQPMAWRGSTTDWVGKPGDGGGAQHDTATYRCLHCGAVTTISQYEPDQPEAE
jgi:hypothetical protein